VEVKPEIAQGNQVVLSVKVGTNHGQDASLAPILQDGPRICFMVLRSAENASSPVLYGALSSMPPETCTLRPIKAET
jgi:hypothetical protein